MLKRMKKLYFLSVLCFMLVLVLPTAKVHAEPETGGNAAGEGAGVGQNKVIGGPYYDKSGWLFSNIFIKNSKMY